MIYRDYLKDKNQNAIKCNKVEGTPFCTLVHSKGKVAKDYKIFGDSFQKTRSGKNLLSYPFSETTITKYGVTFTDNGDGSVTVNGTATANATWYFYKDTKNLINGLKIGDVVTVSIDYDKTWSNSPATMNIVCNYYNSEVTMKDGNCVLNPTYKYKTITITDDWVGIGFYIVVYNGQTVDNITLRAQVELGSIATEYEQYGTMPSPDFPSKVQSVGDLTTKNLFNKEDCHCYEIKSEPPTVININTYAAGVLWSDQLISLFKPNTTYTISCEFECVDVPSDDYTFSNGILGFLIQPKVSGYSSINMLVTHQLVKGEIYHFSKTFTVPSNFSEGTYIMYVYRNSYKNSDGKSITASAICRNIQIEEGSTATEYEPYHKYDIPITVRGKNLLPYPYIYTTKTINGITFTDNGDGSITANGTATANAYFVMVGISWEEEIPFSAGTYTLSGCPAGGGLNTYALSLGGRTSANDNRNIYAQDIGNGKTITINSGRYDFIIAIYSGTTVENLIFKPQLEIGSTATAYEPYKGSQTTHIYLDEPLRKAGEYADYIDFKNQKVVRKVKEITFENIKFNEYSYGTALDNTYHFYIRSMSCILSSSMFCNIMKAGDINMNNAVDDSFFTSRYSNQGNGGIYLQIEKSLINGYSGESNAEKLKAFLIDKNAKLLYCTTEYSEEHISLPALKTFKGTSVISVDTDILPHNIYIKYIRI